MNLPNLLTVFRICLIPVFVGVYFSALPDRILLAVFILAVSCLTDILDGWIARRTNQITSFGKMMDPLADKLTQGAVLVCLAVDRKIPPWMLLLFIAAAGVLIFGSLYFYKKMGTVFSANWYGKIGTVLFYAAVFTILIFNRNMSPQAKYTVMGAALLWIAVSALLYAVAQRKHIRDGKNNETVMKR